MATLDLGKIKQVWRGTYNNGTAYVVDDLVAYTDSGITSTYICVANSTGNAPSSSGTAHASWNYVAKGVVDPVPSQSGNSGKYLTTNGSAASWGTPASGDFEKIAVATGAGGTGDLIFDNLDVATFKTFDFTLIMKCDTDNTSPRFNWRTGGSSGSNIGAAHHQTAYSYLYNSNNQTQVTGMGNTQVSLAEGLGTHAQEGISMFARISMCDANDNGHTKNRMNTIWWNAMCHNSSLMPNWLWGCATLTDSTSGSGGGAGGSTDYPTGFRVDWSSGNVGNFSYQLYGLKR